MTKPVKTVSPDSSIQDAAVIMAAVGGGAVPVQSDDRLVGMVTDRDIVVRAIAMGKAVDSRVEEVMTHDVAYCLDSDDLQVVAKRMGEIQVRRLPVLNKKKQLVGIVSIGDIAKACDSSLIGSTLSKITQPGGQHAVAAVERVI
jgi:CBS domain-containing protein